MNEDVRRAICLRPEREGGLGPRPPHCGALGFSAWWLDLNSWVVEDFWFYYMPALLCTGLILTILHYYINLFKRKKIKFSLVKNLHLETEISL